MVIYSPAEEYIWPKFCLALVEKKFKIRCVKSASCIQKALDSGVVKYFTAVMPSQLTPFVSQMFFYSLDFVEDYISGKLVLRPFDYIIGIDIANYI